MVTLPVLGSTVTPVGVLPSTVQLPFLSFFTVIVTGVVVSPSGTYVISRVSASAGGVTVAEPCSPPSCGVSIVGSPAGVGVGSGVLVGLFPTLPFTLLDG